MEIENQPEKKVETIITEEYQQLLQKIKEKVRSSQLKGAVFVNQEIIKLYWGIG